MILAALDHYTHDFDSGGAHTPPEARLLLAMLARLLRARDVLETGYDAGVTTEALACISGRVVGIDDRSEYGQADVVAHERLDGFSNVELICGSALSFLRECEAESYDLIFIDDAHHVEHVMAEALEVRRVLRPGGIAAFHDTAYHDLWDVVEAAFGDWQRIELPCYSPKMPEWNFGLGLVRKPGLRGQSLRRGDRRGEDMSNWANVPDLSRLQVAGLGPFTIEFRDNLTHETVHVMRKTDSPLPYMIAISNPESPGDVSVRAVPLDVPCVLKGEAEHQTLREVRQYVTSEHCQALRVGLTVHRGLVSSTPHPFELGMHEGFEEIFQVLIEPVDGKVLVEGQGTFRRGEMVDTAWPVRHGQLVCIPCGYHRVVALPDVVKAAPQVSYWWAYLALSESWEKDR